MHSSGLRGFSTAAERPGKPFKRWNCAQETSPGYNAHDNNPNGGEPRHLELTTHNGQENTFHGQENTIHGQDHARNAEGVQIA